MDSGQFLHDMLFFNAILLVVCATPLTKNLKKRPDKQ